MANGMWSSVGSFLTRILDRALLIDENETSPPPPPDADGVTGPDPLEVDERTAAFGADDTQSLGGAIPVIGRGKKLTICIARPKTINEAQQVGERLKMRIPVILNLETSDDDMQQRIADYMSGASHMVDVEIGRAGHKIWVYAPVDMEIEMLKAEQEPQPRAHLFDDQPVFRAMASNQ